MDVSALEGIGLSTIEIKTFVAALELGEAKAGKIIEKTGLQSSSIYHAINSLIRRGLLSYIKKSHVKYYTAADPESILRYIDLKKREYLKILPLLKERQKQHTNKEVTFFTSYNGIKTLFSEMLKEAKRGDIYRTFSLDNPEDYERARKKVFKSVKQIFKEKKIKMKGIFHTSTRYPSTSTSRMNKRYLDAPLPPNTLILNDYVAILSWAYEPVGILIRSKDIADQYARYFDHLWRSASRHKSKSL